MFEFMICSKSLETMELSNEIGRYLEGYCLSSGLCLQNANHWEKRESARETAFPLFSVYKWTVTFNLTVYFSCASLKGLKWNPSSK